METAQQILKRLQEHCEEYNIILSDGDHIQLTMLANSIHLYQKYSAFCNEHGHTQKPGNGGWDQVRPEYTIAQKEHANILKYGAKFGLNPVDRLKLKLKNTEQEDPFADLLKSR